MELGHYSDASTLKRSITGDNLRVLFCLLLKFIDGDEVDIIVRVKGNREADGISNRITRHARRRRNEEMQWSTTARG